ncbi:MAG: hypothetical protein LBN95_04130 [Prevotellaceae bacterium]|jgi:hypothetical protein|nr:hypothetical protein [Prevotellaceae bacterium]
MKKLVFFAISIAIGMSACQKAELAADNNLPVKQKASFAPVANDIRVFNTREEMSKEMDKTMSMSFDELLAYENSIGFHSFGAKADLDYYSVAAKEDEYKSVAEVQNVLENHSKYLQLLEDSTGYTCETKLYDSPYKYLVNDAQMFQVGDTLVKILGNARIVAPVSNYKRLLNVDETTVDGITDVILKNPPKNEDGTDCTFLYEITCSYLLTLTTNIVSIKVYDCDGTTKYEVVTIADIVGVIPVHYDLGRWIERTNVRTGSDGRDNKLWTRVWMEYWNGVPIIDNCAIWIKSHRKGIWNGIYWRTARDIDYHFELYIWTPDNLEDRNFVNTEYDWEVFHKTILMYPYYGYNASGYAYFERTVGYIDSGVNYIPFTFN